MKRAIYGEMFVYLDCVGQLTEQQKTRRNLFIYCWNVSAMVNSHCQPLQTGVESVGVSGYSESIVVIINKFISESVPAKCKYGVTEQTTSSKEHRPLFTACIYVLMASHRALNY